ncbi:MAG: response regulator transcription factor [Bacteroidales bacterium]|nr:response regulator transcription factor [Bacteroidales bacterium]
MSTKKVIIVDSNVYFRDALKRTLEDIGGVEIIAQFSKTDDFLNFITNNNSDIIFTEIRLEEKSGIDLIKRALEIKPELTMIVYTSLEQQCIISRTLAYGARGYLSKSKNNLNILKMIIENPNERIYLSEGLLNVENRIMNSECVI